MTSSRRATGVALAGLLVILAAFSFDASPLFVVGGAFTLIGVLTPLWVRASAHGATVTRRLASERALEGEPVEATIEVRPGPLGLPGGAIRDPLAGDAGGAISLTGRTSLAAGRATAQVRIVARFNRRGVHRLEPPMLILRDMLELASTARTGTAPPQELLILPRIEPVRWTQREGGGRPERSDPHSAVEPLAAVDVEGLRPYRVGTPASRIHWAALARGAGLLERRLQADGETRPLVVLDARGSGPPERLDSAVRAAASLTLELARRGGCRLLLPGERRPLSVEPDLIAWPGVHARLALVEGGTGARPPVLGAAGKLATIFYISAQPVDRLPVALSTLATGGCVLVVPNAGHHRMSAPTAFRVAGCTGYLIGTRMARPGARAA